MGPVLNTTPVLNATQVEIQAHVLRPVVLVSVPVLLLLLLGLHRHLSRPVLTGQAQHGRGGGGG